jgi:uncharacterized protein (TIGR03437 family)
MLLVSMAAWGQPVIATGNAILNASSYASDIAQGSWFVIFGTGMGPATLASASSLPYPNQLAGTSVSFTPTSGGAAVGTLLWYTSAGQLAGLLPSSTATGTYNVTVTYNGQTSAPQQVNVVARNFGYATQAQNGQGPAQATYGGYNLNRFTTGTLGQYATHPAHVGDTVILWGTGLGADIASDISGGSSGDMTAAGQVQVVVGGVSVTPAYAGRSSGSPGLDQINFVVPAGAQSSCFVSLQVKAGGKTSNMGSIAVADAGQSACSTPTLTQSQLSKLDQGGSVVLGSLNLSKTASTLTVPGFGTVNENTESASGSFSKYTIGTIATAAGFSFSQIGSCLVLTETTSSSTGQAALPAPLDAGPQLTLNGPNASNTAIPELQGAIGDYSKTLYSSGVMGFGGTGSPTLQSGTYTISGPGGADVGPFTASVNFPGAFTWTNQSSITSPISRSAGLPITWSGVSTGLVSISGISESSAGGTTQNPIYSVTIFVCTSPASANSFTVPSNVLLQLPVATGDITSGSYGYLSVYATPDATNGQGVFSAPLTAGGAIDQGYFSYSVGSSMTTGWN